MGITSSKISLGDVKESSSDDENLVGLNEDVFDMAAIADLVRDLKNESKAFSPDPDSPGQVFSESKDAEVVDRKSLTKVCDFLSSCSFLCVLILLYVRS
jgi:hypothetical protein